MEFGRCRTTSQCIRVLVLCVFFFAYCITEEMIFLLHHKQVYQYSENNLIGIDSLELCLRYKFDIGFGEKDI